MFSKLTEYQKSIISETLPKFFSRCQLKKMTSIYLELKRLIPFDYLKEKADFFVNSFLIKLFLISNVILRSKESEQSSTFWLLKKTYWILSSLFLSQKMFFILFLKYFIHSVKMKILFYFPSFENWDHQKW